MKSLVLYDSVFGNTEKIAAFMADALEGNLARITDDTDISKIDLLLVGSPTRGFRPTPALTAWLKKLPPDALKGVHAAAFDTRISADDVKSALLKRMMRSGYAAPRIHKALIKKGATAAGQPEGFYVAESEGPLKEGEVHRATIWARSLANT